MAILGLAVALLWFGGVSRGHNFSMLAYTFHLSYLPALLSGIALAVVLILWLLPKHQASQSRGLTTANRFDRENEARKTLAQIIGGVFVLAGLYSSVRTFDLQRQTEDVQRQSEQSQEQGQINERFTKAIDQLGAVLPGAAVEKNGTAKINLEVRLGGIYALEQIAKDAPDKYHWTVIEVLSAYVRENAHWVEAERPESGIEMDVMSRPRADVQAALAVIGRREVTHDPPGRSIDLSVTDLKGVNLIGAHLGSADLRGAYLGRAYVGRAYLEKADLRSAHLEGADFRQAHLRGALLEGAGFIDEELYRAAQLDGLDLSRADLNGTDLRGADLRDVKGLTDDQLEAMRGDSETRLSSGVRRPTA